MIGIAAASRLPKNLFGEQVGLAMTGVFLTKKRE